MDNCRIRFELENKFSIELGEIFEKGAVASGGAVLACLLSEEIRPEQDLDLYVRKSNKVEVCNELIRQGFVFEDGTEIDDEGYKNIKICEIRNYEKDERKVQVLVHELELIEVLMSFDFSFCVNICDINGCWMLCPEYTLQKKGYRLKFNSTRKIEERDKKYRDRGFKIGRFEIEFPDD